MHDEPPADVIVTGDGQHVTVAELLAVLSRQTTPVPGPDERRIREDRHGAALLATAWRHAVFRQARAVLVLFEAGLAAEAQANARVCFEHAIVLRRLALATDRDALEPLMQELTYQTQRRQAAQLDYLDRLDEETGSGHRTLLVAARGQHDASRLPRDKKRLNAATVKAHFADVPHGLHLHNVYRQLSEGAHAGLGSAAPFLLEAVRDGGSVSAEPKSVPWAEAAALLCWACWAADDAMLRFL